MGKLKPEIKVYDNKSEWSPGVKFAIWEHIGMVIHNSRPIVDFTPWGVCRDCHTKMSKGCKCG